MKAFSFFTICITQSNNILFKKECYPNNHQTRAGYNTVWVFFQDVRWAYHQRPAAKDTCVPPSLPRHGQPWIFRSFGLKYARAALRHRTKAHQPPAPRRLRGEPGLVPLRPRHAVSGVGDREREHAGMFRFQTTECIHSTCSRRGVCKRWL